MDRACVCVRENVRACMYVCVPAYAPCIRAGERCVCLKAIPIHPRVLVSAACACVPSGLVATISLIPSELYLGDDSNQRIPG